MALRSLADALRAADDPTLERLLRARPELLTPVPVDLGQLALRAASAPACARTMDRLDRWTLQVLEAACVPVELTRDAVVGLIPQASPVEVGDAIDHLLSLVLLWDDGEQLHPVGGVLDVVGSYRAGFGLPLEALLSASSPSRLRALADDLGLPAADSDALIDILAAHLSDPGTLDALLADSPEGARDVLARLAWGPPVGSIARADRDVRTAAASSPLDWLLAHGLLQPVGADTVVLPYEVGLHLRGGRAFADVRTTAPVPAVETTVAAARVEAAAAGEAFGFVRAVEDLLDAWGLEPPTALKAGGLGVRELRKAAALLDREEWAAALVIEVAYAAGLVGTTGSLDDEWLPTPAYDRWRSDDPAQRWATLVDAWLRTTRTPGLVGVRDDRDKPSAALGPDLDRVMAPEVRGGVLHELAQAADRTPGAVVAADPIVETLTWRRPRRPPRLRAELVGWTLREAELLGVTGAGSLSRAVRPLIDGDVDGAAELLAPLLPEPLDHVLLQADLTAVAPGPLVTDLAHELALAADVESTGGATVYRFTEASVRRALDAGRSADDLHAFLARHSRTPVPQPLTYLVDDIARRHGRIRVGTASSYVRCDDPATLDELVAHRRASELRLRRLAATVATSQAPPDLVLARLRELGYAPAAEGPDGAVVIRRPDSRRTPARPRPPRLVAEQAPPSDTLVAAAVRALRAGDRATTSTRGRVVYGPSGGSTRTGNTMTLELLRAALDAGRPVWIGYVDGQGGVTERVVDPVRLEGGYLTAYDHRYERVHTFAVHRITGVAELEPADEA